MANQEMACVAARSDWQNCGAGGLGVRAAINLFRPLEPCRYVGFRANKPTSKRSGSGTLNALGPRQETGSHL